MFVFILIFRCSSSRITIQMRMYIIYDSLLCARLQSAPELKCDWTELNWTEYLKALACNQPLNPHIYFIFTSNYNFKIWNSNSAHLVEHVCGESYHGEVVSRHQFATFKRLTIRHPARTTHLDDVHIENDQRQRRPDGGHEEVVVQSWVWYKQMTQNGVNSMKSIPRRSI